MTSPKGPTPEFLAEVGVSAERFETWRRETLSRPPLAVPADDATPEELAAWRRETFGKPLQLPFDDEADGAQP